MLFIDVLRSYVGAKKFDVHDFVVMPDHVHLLVTVSGEMSIEKAVQFIKGSFSYRLKKELDYSGEVWQRGFSEVRVNYRESFARYREYIAQNPVKRGLVSDPEEYPYASIIWPHEKQGLKPKSKGSAFGTTEVVP